MMNGNDYQPYHDDEPKVTLWKCELSVGGKYAGLSYVY